MTRKQQRFYHCDRASQWEQLRELACVQGAGMYQVNGPHYRHIWWYLGRPHVVQGKVEDRFLAKVVGARVTAPN